MRFDKNTEQNLLDTALDLARALAEADSEQADRYLAALVQSHNSGLFKQMGEVTRDLHDALSNIELNAQFADLAMNRVPDAQNRLDYVIAKTEEAAHQTLTSVEKTTPIVKHLAQRAQALHEQLARHRPDRAGAADVTATLAECATFTQEIGGCCKAIHAGLTDIMTAQSFQDLTGQVILRVIDTVKEVETRLVEIIRLHGGEHPGPAARGAREAEGPQIDPRGANVVQSQDEVDALLSSLGF